MQKECAYVVLLSCCFLGNESFVELPIIFFSEFLTFGKASLYRNKAVEI
jgi:hypothetical protein